MANLTKDDSKSQNQYDIYDKELSHSNTATINDNMNVSLPTNKYTSNKQKFAMEEKEEKEKEDSINVTSDVEEDHKDENDNNLGKKIRDKFSDISSSFIQKYDELLQKFNQTRNKLRDCEQENTQLKTIQKEQDEQIKKLNDEIFNLNQQIAEQELGSPTNDNLSMDEYQSEKEQTPNTPNQMNSPITPEPTDSDNKINNEPPIQLKQRSTSLILDHILSDMNEEYDNMPETEPLILQNDSSIQISINGTPIAATGTNNNNNNTLTHEPQLLTRASVKQLMGSNIVKNLTHKYEKRNDGILDQVNEEQTISTTTQHKSSDMSLTNHSLSHSHSFRTTTKPKHKNKRKPKNATSHRTYVNGNEPHQMKRSSTLDRNIPTQANVSPRISIEKIIPIPSKVSNHSNTRNSGKLITIPSTKALGVKKHKHKSRKSASPRPNNGYRPKPKQKKKENLKSRANPMLNSKQRKPSMLHLFTKGKNQKKKSKK